MQRSSPNIGTHHISLWLNTPEHIIEFLCTDVYFKTLLCTDENFNTLIWVNIWQWGFEEIINKTYWYSRSYFKDTISWIIFSFPKGWLKPNTAYTVYFAWKWENWDWKLEIWDFRIHPNYEDDNRSDPKVIEFWKSIRRLWNIRFHTKSINIEVAERQDFTPRQKVKWVVVRFAKRVVNVVSWMSKSIWRKRKSKKK